MRRVSIFGLGRVGLVTAVCLAGKGYDVIGIDPDYQRIRRIRNAEPPFFEKGLAENLRKVVAKRRLSLTQDGSSNSRSDLAFVTVGTPSRKDGGADLSFVREGARMIGESLRYCRLHQLVLIKSTVIPGTTRNVVRPMIQKSSGKIAGKHFTLCSNPEFLREGNAIHDTLFPDRIIIGAENGESSRKAAAFYKEFYGKRMPPVIRTTYENAELIKYANNAFLATKVSFINCIANIAELVPHTDVKTVSSGIGLDARIAPTYLDAGLGWGGACLPKDLNALIHVAKKSGYYAGLLEAVVSTNEEQWRRAPELAKKILGSLKGKKIAILGLAFKPKTDDIRGAVSVFIVGQLLKDGALVTAYDPAAMRNARALFDGQIRIAKDSRACIAHADCCIVVTEWDEFRSISASTFFREMRTPFVIDGRRVYDADEFLRAGVRFTAIGLGARKPAKMIRRN